MDKRVGTLLLSWSRDHMTLRSKIVGAEKKAWDSTREPRQGREGSKEVLVDQICLLLDSLETQLVSNLVDLIRFLVTYPPIICLRN